MPSLVMAELRTTDPSPAGDRRVGCGTQIAPALAAFVAIVAAGLGLAYGRFTAPAPAPSVQVIRPTPNVVVAVRELARLEGAEYHVERVIDLSEKQKRLFGLVEAADAILLVASGDVVAGVDLSKLASDSIEADPEAKRVRIRLPRAKIFSTRVDNERTYVHSRDTDLLAKRNENLESDARREAERAIREAALESGIQERAEKGVRRTLEGLTRGLGYEQIEIVFEGS